MSMTLISTLTVGSGGASSLAFNSIPQTYTDLLLLGSARCSTTSSTRFDITFTPNGTLVSSARKLLYGTGSSAAFYTDSFPVHYIESSGPTANTFDNSSVYIPNYTGSTAKGFTLDLVTENNATGADQLIQAGYWGSTAAINTLTLTTTSGTFVQYSTYSLYGILKGSGGATVS